MVYESSVPVGATPRNIAAHCMLQITQQKLYFKRSSHKQQRWGTLQVGLVVYKSNAPVGAKLRRMAGHCMGDQCSEVHPS